jgi:hypothetical protein
VCGRCTLALVAAEAVGASKQTLRVRECSTMKSSSMTSATRAVYAPATRQHERAVASPVTHRVHEWHALT